MLKKFWAWYERHYLLNVSIAAGLFAIQLIHLYWLTADVVSVRLFGQSFFELNKIWETIMVLVDYTEIPAIIGTSLVYINSLRKNLNWKPALFLFFINSQWLHIFWITDEFVVEKLTGAGAGTILPTWLAWVAILIDYLELPVIYDTIRRFLVLLGKKGPQESLRAFKDSN
jgi:hypothetical protein